MFTEFVVEDPNTPQERPRRPRVVVSCDYCRGKKIKCRHTPGQPKCNNCTEAGKRCTYRDRDRYHADRDRVYASRLAELSSSSIPSAAGEASGLTAPAPLTYGSSYVVPVGDQGAAMMFYSVTPGGPATQVPTGLPAPAPAAEPAEEPPSPQPNTSRSTSLEAAAPSSVLMAPLIEVFFRYYGTRFTFVEYEHTVGNFLRSELGPFLANCIAALAVPLARDVMELALTDLKAAAEAFLTRAKGLVPEEGVVNWEDLKGIVLLAYAVRKAGDYEAFEIYVQRAIDAAYALGLPDERHVKAISVTERDQIQLTALWKHILRLHQTMMEGDSAQGSPRSTGSA